jgi:hypothetical protein
MLGHAGRKLSRGGQHACGFPAGSCETALWPDLQEPLCVSPQADPSFSHPREHYREWLLPARPSVRETQAGPSFCTKTNPNCRTWCSS